MPPLKVIRQGNAALPLGPPLVVAIIGGTTGIGSYTTRALARTFSAHGSKLRVYIIGRNASSADSHISYGKATAPGSEWIFIPASDLALLSDVDTVSRKIIDAEEQNPFAGGPARLDVLYMTQALSPLQPSPLTTEGLDSQLSLLYYSRMRFIQNLTPLLTSPKSPPQSSRVISIFAGNMEDSIKSHENLPIGPIPPSTYGITTVRRQATFMKTFAFEHLAQIHAGKVSFTHIYPGLVDGPNFYNPAITPLWFRCVWRVLKPLVWWYVTSEEDCGDVMVSLGGGRYPAKGESIGDGDVGDGNERAKDVVGGVAFSSKREKGGGAYAVGMRGDERGDVSWKNVRMGDTEERVWGDLMGTFERVEKMNEGK